MAPEVIGRISHLAIHPVKGAGIMELNKAILTPEGLEGDRRYMVVRASADEDGIYNFVTQRDKRDKVDKPQGLSVMSLIKPQMVDDTLLLTWDGKDPIEVPPDLNNGKELPVRIWETVVQAIDQGQDLQEWLRDHLDTDVRLVKAAGSFQREARQNYHRNNNTLRFQDGYPVHWFMEESVDELSQIAGEEIQWKIFRPNIVGNEGTPQVEHLVFSGEIAGIPFIDPKPSDRCPVTNVDQDTGEVKLGRVLNHLATYKRWNSRDGKKKVIFGENMLPLASGEIKLGDEIVLTERRSPPLVYGAK